LTAPARDSVWDLWVGAKKPASDRTKKLTKKKMSLYGGVDKKSPIQAEVRADPRAGPFMSLSGPWVEEWPRLFLPPCLDEQLVDQQRVGVLQVGNEGFPMSGQLLLSQNTSVEHLVVHHIE
jgi:hypothetical protein